MSKDANSFGHDKALAWKSRGFVYTKKRMHRFDTPSQEEKIKATSPGLLRNGRSFIPVSYAPRRFAVGFWWRLCLFLVFVSVAISIKIRFPNLEGIPWRVNLH